MDKYCEHCNSWISPDPIIDALEVFISSIVDERIYDIKDQLKKLDKIDKVYTKVIQEEKQKDALVIAETKAELIANNRKLHQRIIELEEKLK